MDSDYVFLTEKEAMWAEMLMEALQKANIPSTSVPVYGAGLVMRAGVQERLRIYVPLANKPQAEELLEELNKQIAAGDVQ